MLDLFLGAAMSATTGIVGYLAGRSRARVARSLEMPKPVCPCLHPISFHANLTGSCNGTVDVAIRWDSYGDERGWKKDPCPCGNYVGPELISQVTMRALTTEQE